MLIAFQGITQSSKKQYRVTIFLAIDCPISQDYVIELNKMYAQFKSEIDFLAVFPGRLKAKAIEAFCKAYGVAFPIKRDPNFLITKRLGATVTPHAFLTDYTGRIWYQGAIDNWYYELGRHRSEPSDFFLINAIQELVARKPISKPITRPIGCFINLPKI